MEYCVAPLSALTGAALSRCRGGALALVFAATLALPAPLLATETLEHSDQKTEEGIVDAYTAKAQQLISQGMEYLGIRYRRGGDSPETGLDCSGLVQNVFRNALGLDLPRTAREMARLGEKIGYQDLKPGDLVFFNTMRRAFSHVGIYLGDGRFLHAPASGGQVRVETIDKSYWTKRFDGARRLVEQADSETIRPH